MRNWKHKGSYTVEAAIYIPLILFVFFHTLEIAIDFWQESRERKVCEELLELDIMKEFYGYQILDEVGRELEDNEP